MYKIIFLDLDGTLLSSNKEISKYNENILKKISYSTKIVLASARGFSTIKPYLEQLNLLNDKNYTIAFNGSLVLDNLENKIINVIIKKSNIILLEKIVKESPDLEWYYYTYNDRINRKEIENIDYFVSNNNIYKVVCISSESQINKLKNEIAIQLNHNFEMTSSESTRIEFVPKGKTKVDSIKKLLSVLNINSEEVIAIGDGENDVEMIEYAGCGIAMGNSKDNVKKVANLITDTNDNDGVGKILENLLVNNL